MRLESPYNGSDFYRAGLFHGREPGIHIGCRGLCHVHRKASGFDASRIVLSIYSSVVSPLAAMATSRAVDALLGMPFFLSAPGRLPPFIRSHL
jgi:hypothetical protein